MRIISINFGVVTNNNGTTLTYLNNSWLVWQTFRYLRVSPVFWLWFDV